MIEIFKLFADENRLKIFIMLLHDEYCVCDIERFLDMKQANVSKHLTKFKDLDLLAVRKEQKWIHYAISDPAKKDLNHLIDYIKTQALYLALNIQLDVFEKNICTPKKGEK